MQARHIKPEWVEAAARMPQWIEPEPNDPRIERRFCAIEDFWQPDLASGLFRDGVDDPCYKRDVRPKREAQAMIDMTYDPKADAVYIQIARGTIDETKEAGPFAYDVDAEGRLLGIEILAASKILAPGEWKNSRQPSETRFDAAE